MWAGLQLDCELIFRLMLSSASVFIFTKSTAESNVEQCMLGNRTKFSPALWHCRARTEPVQMFMNTRSVTEANNAT